MCFPSPSDSAVRDEEQGNEAQPERSCADVVRSAGRLWMDDARAETDQLLEAIREQAAGRYTTADFARDVQATCERTSKLWTELGQLSLESWRVCLADPFGALRGLTGEGSGRRAGT